MSLCILHVSDLHLGAGSDPSDAVVNGGIQALIARVDPQLIVVSGDLTHHGRSAEHDAAAQYLRSLERPLLVIPGNHDIPPFSPARLTRPWRDFKRNWETTTPTHLSDELVIVGLNSVNPLRYQRGHVPASELLEAERILGATAPGALRVVTVHHQLAGAPWRLRKLPLAGRSNVLTRLADAGTELILSGHIHQATVIERREFEVVGRETTSCVLTTAPGLGRPRPGRRYEVRGVLVHRADASSLSTETHVWHGEDWQLTGTRTFARS